MLENIQGRDKYNQSIRKHCIAKGHRTPSISLIEEKLEEWLECKSSYKLHTIPNIELQNLGILMYKNF